MTVRRMILASMVLISLAGCTSSPDPAFDYSAYKTSDPKSILVLPPINHSNEVIAPYGVLAHVTKPLAEAGYYVFPVALVDETFKHNGLTQAEDIHQVSVHKLHEIFAADTALYLEISRYGTTYVVISSDTVVSVSARLVDLRNGQQLWQGKASAAASESEDDSQQTGLIGMLVDAAITQIFDTLSDQGFEVAKKATTRLLSTGGHSGLLPGPRSPDYAPVLKVLPKLEHAQ